jgi:hypothetical protein
MRAFCSMFGITLLLSFAFASASTAQAGSETAWKVSALGGGQQMASIRTSGPSEPKRGMALTCQGKAPMLVIPTTRIGTKPRGNLAMTGTTGGIPVAVSMIWDPQGSAWVASMSDRAALDLLAGASTSVSLTLDGTALGTIPLTGSSNAIRTALAGCYVPVAAPVLAVGLAGPSGGKSVAGEGRAIFLDASLPEVLRRDLAEFEASCNYAFDDWPPRPGARRGPALAAAGAVQRADFNGDAIDDYLLDTAKLRCTRRDGANTPANGTYAPTNMVMIYTSTNAGGHIHSLDATLTSYRITSAAPAGPGGKASLFLHQAFVPKDEFLPDSEGDEVPLVNETLTMRDQQRWNSGKLGVEDWRSTASATYPAALTDQVARWDSECAAVGRRLTFFDGFVDGIDQMGSAVHGSTWRDVPGRDPVERPVDLNGDGKRDFVIDTSMLRCGVFGLPRDPRQPYYCGSGCTLIAVISRPDSSYVLDRVAGSISMEGNGDPAAFVRSGKQDAIRWRCDEVVTWTGTTQRRIKGRYCDY